MRDEKNENALHPQSDEQVEYQHHTILNYLTKFVSENQDWDRWIPLYLLAYRSAKHEATGMTAELFAQDFVYPSIYYMAVFLKLRRLILLKVT